MLFSVIICRIWSFATAINKLLFDKNCHICNSYQKGAIFYQSHKVFYTTNYSAVPANNSRLYLPSPGGFEPLTPRLGGLLTTVNPSHVPFTQGTLFRPLHFWYFFHLFLPILLSFREKNKRLGT